MTSSQYITQRITNYNTNYTITGNNEEIYEQLIDNILFNYDLSNGEELVFQGEDNSFFHITNAQNELDLLKKNNNNTNKFSIIDLGECANLLKKYYHINENETLLIMKLEKLSNISSERFLQYEVYDPINKSKLNLTICNNITIDIYVPVTLSVKLQNIYDELQNMGYDLFDINNPFYQDICTPYKSSDGTDILLSDRINSFYNNDETTCQSNCKFTNYLMESHYMKCDCDINNSEINTKNTQQFSVKSVFQSFASVLQFSNYKVLKCSKLAFNINSLTKNIGSILSIIYFLIYSVFLVIYITKGISQIKSDISICVLKKNEFNKIENEKEKNEIKKEGKNQKQKLNNYKQNNIIIRDVKRKKKRFNLIIFTYPPKKIYLKLKNNLDNSSKFNISKGLYDNNILVTNKSKLSNPKKNKENNEINKQIFDIMKIGKDEKVQLDIYQINNLEYDLAKKLDKRNFIEIFWSLLKREHLIIFTFLTRDDHNLVFIKYSRFIFLLCTDMAMNVFFFSDETMHKMYLDYGKYNFIQQIPQIIYSTIVSKLIETFLCYLSLTDKHYYQIKECKKVTKKSMRGILKCIQLKIGFFFGFTSLMFIFYWYLIACFCSVYPNSQAAFIKDTLLSFVLGNTIPFGIFLIPSFFRILSLKTEKYKLEWVYNISNMIPFF